MRSVLILLCMLLLICTGFAKDSSAIAGEQISVLIVDGRNNHKLANHHRRAAGHP
jgi:hypothetical protein